MQRGRNKLIALGATALVAVTVFMGGTPAWAAFQAQGNRTCTGTRTPALYLNTSGGGGVWTKYPSGFTPVSMTFGSGPVTKYSPYQATNWSINSANSYATPYTSCV